MDLIAFAHNNNLEVEGLSFHVGSQCTNPANYSQALDLAASIFAEAKTRGFNLKLLDIGGGFPAHYDDTVPPFRRLAKMINAELDRLFPENDRNPRGARTLPGRLRRHGRLQIIGKAVRGGKLCYYINDGVYHTYSGMIFDHCQYRLKSFKKGPTQICSVFGPTCDALDTISLAEQLPDMEMGDLSTPKTSAPIPPPAARRSTDSHPPRLCMCTSNVLAVRRHEWRRGTQKCVRYAATFSFFTKTFEFRPLWSYFSRRLGRKVVGRAFGKAALRLEVSERLRR